MTISYEHAFNTIKQNMKELGFIFEHEKALPTLDGKIVTVNMFEEILKPDAEHYTSTKRYYFRRENSSNLAFYIDEDDVKSFQNYFEYLDQVDTTETSILYEDYIEILLEDLNPIPRPRSMRDKEIVFENPSESNSPKIEISQPSQLFIDTFIKTEVGKKNFFNRSVYFSEPPSRKDAYRPYKTAKIWGISGTTKATKIQNAHKHIEACLFYLACNYNWPFNFLDTWPQRKKMPQLRADQEISDLDILPLPYTKPKSEPLKYYTRALSTRDPFVKFLSLYQVIEFFFISTSDQVLHDKIKQKIMDPRFRPTSKNLEQVVQYTLDHKRETDETKMLTNVLKKYISPEELAEEITQQEKDTQIYSKKKTMWGCEYQPLELKNKEHLLSQLSKRIKSIRNTLIHSSDRYEGKERYTPSRQSDNLISREIPILQYIAEQVLIGSSEV